jgi:hypothetical protein
MAQKKGYMPDGSIDRSYRFTDAKSPTGYSYADGSPAQSVYAQAKDLQAQQQANDNKAAANNWAPYGGLPGAGVPKKGDEWKQRGYLSNANMKNPVQIGGLFYDAPVQNKNYNPVPMPTFSPSGAQMPIPTVQQRMSRMGQAVQKGVAKGSIKANQLNRYQVPGQQAPSSPLAKQLGNPEPDYQFYTQMPNSHIQRESAGQKVSPASPLVNQLQGSQGYYNPASNPQQTGNTYNQGYPIPKLANYSAPKPVPLPQGKSRGS